MSSTVNQKKINFNNYIIIKNTLCKKTFLQINFNILLHINKKEFIL
jgi:hypothetical protein